MLKNIYEYINDSDFRLTLFFDKIHIINYSEILSIKINQIIIRVLDKKIKIMGNNLVLKKLLDKEILILGNVNSIGVINE